MKERLVACLGLLILSSDTFIGSFVGAQVANLVVALPFIVLAYVLLVVYPALSGEYRARVGEFFGVLAERKLHALAFAAYLALFLFSFLRAVQFGTFDLVRASYLLIKWASVTVVLIGVALDLDGKGGREPLLRAIVIGSAVYSAVNLLVIGLGITNANLDAGYLGDPGQGSMFAMLGLNVERIALPMSGGKNTSGIQVACGLVFGYALMRRAEGMKGRLFGLVLAGATLVALLLTDSRGGVLGAGAGILAAFIPAPLRRRSRWLSILLPVLPGLLLLFVVAFQSSAWMLEFQRGGVEGVGGGLTGRPFIWASIVLFLTSFTPTHLFGFGTLGQIGSGVSTRYAAIFAGSYSNPYGMGAHNTVLQAILDTGYIGAFLQVVLFWCLLDAFGRDSGKEGAEGKWGLVGFTGVVALMFLGITGETLSSGSTNTLLIFLALNIHCLTRRSVAPDSAPTPI